MVDENDPHYQAIKKKFWRRVYLIKAIIYAVFIVVFAIVVRKNF